jgi:pimeloyl-ACP methyl ester carboxylesterase
MRFGGLQFSVARRRCTIKVVVHKGDPMPETQPSLSRFAFGRGLVLCLLFLLVCTGLSACGGSSTTTTQGIQGKQVTFTTEDGVVLSGHLFGGGTNGIVLSHMYPADQKSWYPTAKKLATLGYLVLTYDFRGYGLSEGMKQIDHIDRDVLAACREIAEAGAENVVLIGASMGGTASLEAAAALFTSQLSVQTADHTLTVAGVATLSAPVSFQGLAVGKSLADIYCPLLFIAGKKDVGADGALELERLSGNTGDLEIVSGSDHGTDLLAGSHADDVYDLLLKFLEKNLPLKD